MKTISHCNSSLAADGDFRPKHCIAQWQTTPTGKQPFRFTRKDGGFFCMAGLWERWLRPSVDADSDTVLFPFSDPGFRFRT